MLRIIVLRCALSVISLRARLPARLGIAEHRAAAHEHARHEHARDPIDRALPSRSRRSHDRLCAAASRHIKLGLAGAAQNWVYAAHELTELMETFDNISKLVPKHGNLSLPDAIASTIKQPMAALDKATKAKEEAAFTSAYAHLTSACNDCHRSADHGAIVIQVPNTSPFADQDFRAS